MASLWRTQRPRFPQYISDGNGRDYYIKYNNAGYWESQFKVYKKPDYEYPKYSNYHSLFHQAAPFKYYATGNGRETYIINAGGLYHDQKPLACYKLDDFLRESQTMENVSKFQSKNTNVNGAQIIFTTHNTELMNMELLRKDQLYFVDKGIKDGVSELYSVSELGTRTTDNIRKGYMLGKYGATPDVQIEEVE